MLAKCYRTVDDANGPHIVDGSNIGSDSSTGIEFDRGFDSHQLGISSSSFSRQRFGSTLFLSAFDLGFVGRRRRRRYFDSTQTGEFLLQLFDFFDLTFPLRFEDLIRQIGPEDGLGFSSAGDALGSQSSVDVLL